MAANTSAAGIYRRGDVARYRRYNGWRGVAVTVRGGGGASLRTGHGDGAKRVSERRPNPSGASVVRKGQGGPVPGARPPAGASVSGGTLAPPSPGRCQRSWSRDSWLVCRWAVPSSAGTGAQVNTMMQSIDHVSALVLFLVPAAFFWLRGYVAGFVKSGRIVTVRLPAWVGWLSGHPHKPLYAKAVWPQYFGLLFVVGLAAQGVLQLFGAGNVRFVFSAVCALGILPQLIYWIFSAIRDLQSTIRRRRRWEHDHFEPPWVARTRDPEHQIKLPRNYVKLALWAIFLAIGIFEAVYATWVPFISTAHAGNVSSIPLWIIIAALDVLVIAGGVLLCFRLVLDFRVVLSDEGIWKPGVISPGFMRWSDVRKVTFDGAGITLNSDGESIRINFRPFRNPKQLEEVVRDHVPGAGPPVTPPPLQE